MTSMNRKHKSGVIRRSRRGNGISEKDSSVTQRVIDEEDDALNENIDDTSYSEEEFQEDGPSKEHDEAPSKPHPYSILLQSLQQGVEVTEPRRKKRKLDQPQHLNASALEALEPEATEQDPLLEDVDVDDERIATVAVNEDSDGDDEDTDPFEMHLGSYDEKDVSEGIRSIDRDEWREEKSRTSLYKAMLSTPGQTKGLNALQGQSKITSPRTLRLKRRLILPALNLLPTFDELQRELVPYIFNYVDLLFTARTVKNAAHLRSMTCLHTLNHIFKTRDRVLKNNARLAKLTDGDELELRDQGFTRPRVLFLLETRQSCAKTMEMIMKFAEPEQQENKKRFQDAFIDNEERFGDDRPEDFRELFEGNADNDFRLGLKFTRKTVRYFSPFYSSDMIFASPLGLRRIIEHEDPKKREHDFLSSIEVLVIDQADAMLQQNWDHVEFVMSYLNLQPKEAHGCDFSRVRNWYLDNRAKHFRQTILFSAYATPEINKLFRNSMLNIAGRAKVQTEYDGSYLSINVPLKQTFSRIDSVSPTAEPDARFKYFTTVIIPSLVRHTQPADSSTGGPGILIFIPSYLDFVRVRNYFANSSATQNISFGSVSEYADTAEVQRARARFVNGKHAVLLYTGRAHHFRRYRIRGVKRVVFYGLPENPIFYREIIEGFLGQTIAEWTVDVADVELRVLFSRLEALKLERLVGTKRVGSMLREKEGDTFEFIS